MHPEMVEVKTRSCPSSNEKQVKKWSRGGNSVENVCKKRGRREEESGVIRRLVSRSEHCVSKLLSAAIKLSSITKCALCTHVSISLCQQHNGKLCSLRLTHCKYTQGLKDAGHIT